MVLLYRSLGDRGKRPDTRIPETHDRRRPEYPQDGMIWYSRRGDSWRMLRPGALRLCDRLASSALAAGRGGFDGAALVPQLDQAALTEGIDTGVAVGPFPQALQHDRPGAEALLDEVHPAGEIR